MTRALCVADIHLNLNNNSEWEANRFSLLFDYLADAEEEYVYLLGDIFDKARPSLEELSLFYQNIAKLKRKVVRLIAGNHEILAKDVTLFDKIPSVGFKYYRDFDIVKMEDVNIYLCGNNKLDKLKNLKSGSLSSKVNILMTHVRCDIPPHVKEELPLKPLSNMFDYIIAGDIHSLYRPFDNFYYTNQPYSTTYVKDKAHHIIRLSVDKKDVKIQHIPISFPNKILKVPVLCEVPPLNSKDLFKIRITGTLKELLSFENKGNVRFDKVVEDLATADIKKIKRGKKLDLEEHIIAVLKDDLSEDSLAYGKKYLKEILEGTGE